MLTKVPAVKSLLLLLMVSCVTICGHAQARFGLPISGTCGKDFLLVNYVDWALDTFYADNYCSTKTYDGHQGTDFVIRNFRKMDSGVDVRAADNGRVIFVQDGIFDREKTSVVSKGLGNYIGITHSGKLQTYYGHLRKNSILVHKGDSVIAGQKLALVGSSGNTSDPHLHFELWYDSSYYIDPFSGPCGNAGTYWLSQPPFDTSFGMWTSGMCNYVCTLDTLKEEPKRTDTFYSKDPAITYWDILYGLRKNDSIRIEWYDPVNTLWLSYGNRLTRDWWYYYFWSYINTPSTGLEGKWSLKLFRNNNLVHTRPFYFYKKASGVKAYPEAEKYWQVYNIESVISVNGLRPGDVVQLLDLNGRSCGTIVAERRSVSWNKADLAAGLYVLQVNSAQGGRSFEKLVIR